MTASKYQVGGQHYASPIQCWDYIIANDIGYLEGTAIKYLTRWKKKNGIEDLKKAKHFIEKLIETEEAKKDYTLNDAVREWALVPKDDEGPSKELSLHPRYA